MNQHDPAGLASGHGAPALGPQSPSGGVRMQQGEAGTDCSPENLPQGPLGKTENR